MAGKASNILSFLAGVVVTIIGFFVLTIYVSFFHEKERSAQTADSEEAVETVETIETDSI